MAFEIINLLTSVQHNQALQNAREMTQVARNPDVTECELTELWYESEPDLKGTSKIRG